jgi:chitin disaccharide deacetylase
MRRRYFLAGLLAPAVQSASTAEALGYPAEAKLLLVHADDAGMCHSANVATQEAMRGGLVSSASMMAPCPWFPEMAAWARENPAQDLGIHLTLTSEWKHFRWRPVAPLEQVKGLVDAEGFLWRDVRSVATSASAREVEIELRAQIARAKQFGVAFTHLDTHMGTLYARPDYFAVYARLAKENRVPCMLPRPTAETAAELKAYPITAEMITAMEREGHVLLDRLVTGVKGRTVEERRLSYVDFLANLKPGVTKLIVHLAKDDAEIRAVTGNWQTRWADFVFFTSPEARALMDEHKIRLTTYRELGRLLKF